MLSIVQEPQGVVLHPPWDYSLSDTLIELDALYETARGFPRYLQGLEPDRHHVSPSTFYRLVGLAQLRLFLNAGSEDPQERDRYRKLEDRVREIVKETVIQ